MITKQDQLAELEANIAQGEAFERQGYDCGMVLALTYALRDKLMHDVQANQIRRHYMTRVFISGPIRNMPDYNRPAFMAAEKMLTDQGCAVMNPIKLHPANPDAFSHDDYMHVCLAMLDVCDAIYLLPGWMDSEGARKEATYAAMRGKAVWEVVG